MAAVQPADVRASFLFVGDLNGHHQELLGSTTTNSHGVAGLHFATVSGCDQLVIGPTHARGGILNLLMTDVPNLTEKNIWYKLTHSGESRVYRVIIHK